MVWSATPADNCVVAIGIGVLAWTMTPAFALRGLSLRPVAHNYPAAPPVFRPEFRHELSIHATIRHPAHRSTTATSLATFTRLPH